MSKLKLNITMSGRRGFLLRDPPPHAMTQRLLARSLREPRGA